MSPTDSQPKEKAHSSSTPVQQSQGGSSTPSLVRYREGFLVRAKIDCPVLDPFQPIFDPSSWTRQPTQPVNGGSTGVPRPLFGTGGNRLGGGSSWFGGGAGGGGGGGTGRPRNGGINTLGGLGGGGTVDACRGTCG